MAILSESNKNSGAGGAVQDVNLSTALSSVIDSVAAVASGDVAHDAVDSGNPIKIGGKSSADPPAAVATGDRVNASMTNYGAQRVMLSSGAVDIGTNTQYGGDNVTLGNYMLRVEAAMSAASGADTTKLDRMRNNGTATLLASAERTATTSSTDQTNYNWRGAHIVIDVTAIAATPSIVVTVQGKDVISGKYYTILTSAAITGTGTTVLRIYPGLVAVANLTISDILPRLWRVSVVAADADSITYSVGASQIL